MRRKKSVGASLKSSTEDFADGKVRRVRDQGTLMAWWWMSFVDPHGTPGERFLGGLLIEADDIEQAIKQSWRRKLNPGGEIAFFEVPIEYEYRIDASITYRLLSRAECEAIERKWPDEPSEE
jgi:hypothetical protein